MKLETASNKDQLFRLVNIVCSVGSLIDQLIGD